MLSIYASNFFTKTLGHHFHTLNISSHVSCLLSKRKNLALGTNLPTCIEIVGKIYPQRLKSEMSKKNYTSKNICFDTWVLKLRATYYKT